jgi:uncharacterized membrane protein
MVRACDSGVPMNKNMVMRRVALCVAALILASSFASAKSKSDKALNIYFIDVEGGQSTLIVTPAGQSMLVDTGWSDFNGRDAARIADAAKQAGVSKLDYVWITHYHNDHVGGVPALLEKIKVGTFIDHGENQEHTDQVNALYAAYQKAIAGSKHMVIKPGDRVPLKGVNVEALTANGEHIAKPLAGAGQCIWLCLARLVVGIALFWTPFLGIGAFILRSFVGLIFFIAWLIAIVNAFQGKLFKLPVIGDLAESQANKM